MDRRRKDSKLAFYDEFYSMPLNEQAIALGILQEHHRVEAKRQQAKAKKEQGTLQMEAASMNPMNP